MKARWSELFPALSPDCRRAMDFLYTHLPESDLGCYSVELFRQFAEHALMLREKAPWCAALSQEAFDHYVLFPRVNDEDLSCHREVFFEALWPRVREQATMEARILEVNRWCHEMAAYEMQDDRTASPLTVYRSGSGRCGEESAFLVSALRSVGIPARQVYVPRWAHCDDNHAWVEALCGGEWKFLGACEPEPVLNRGWFNTLASRAVLVHSRIFGAGEAALHGEFLCREGGVCWYNQTARYARVREYTFRAVLAESEAPAAGAEFQIQLLNEAGYHTIATLTADENGEARANLGLGDIHILAALGEAQGEGDCVDRGITLLLAPVSGPDIEWRDFDVHAPKSENVNPADLDAAQRASRAAERRRGDELRAARVAEYTVCGSDLTEAARGNGHVIAAFLERDGEALLRTLAPKDLRDVTPEVLEDHLGNAPARGRLPREVWLRYVLCPRIQWEPLTPWRGILKEALTSEEQETFRGEPGLLWTYLTQRMDLQVDRTYSNLVWAPDRAWLARRCDKKSLGLLFVAMLRTLGVPARLGSPDGVPEYWKDGAFHPVTPRETGTLRLLCAAGTPRYRQNWTLAARTDPGWKQLSLSDDWEGGEYTVELPAGVYRLLTAVRLPNGNQYAARRELEIHPGMTTESDLRLRPYALTDMLGCQALPPLRAVTPEGERIEDLRSMIRRPALLFWLEEGAEPTAHILHELAARRKALEALPVEIVFFLRRRESLAHPGISRLLNGWPGIQVLLDDWSYDLEAVARCLTCDPDTPPLTVVWDGGSAVYGASGYRVGLAELLVRMAVHLSGA